MAGVNKYSCSICLTKYDEFTDAKRCEQKGIVGGDITVGSAFGHVFLNQREEKNSGLAIVLKREEGKSHNLPLTVAHSDFGISDVIHSMDKNSNVILKLNCASVFDYSTLYEIPEHIYNDFLHDVLVKSIYNSQHKNRKITPQRGKMEQIIPRVSNLAYQLRMAEAGEDYEEAGRIKDQLLREFPEYDLKQLRSQPQRALEKISL